LKEGIVLMETENTNTASDTQTAEHPSSGQGKVKKKTLLLGVIAALVLAGVLFYFFYLGSPSRQVLAQVNGEKITVEEFNKEVEKVDLPLRDMLREEPLQYLEGLIMKRIVLQEAKNQGIAPPPKTYKDADKGPSSPDDHLIAELMKKQFPAPPVVTQQEIQAFYSMFKDRMEGKPLDQVAPAIEQVIRQGKQQEALESYLATLRKNASVEIDQIRLSKIAAKPPESNTDEDFKKALQSGKPVLVDFGANSCVPCRELRPILKDMGKEYSGKASILVIDVYKYQNLAQDYKITLIPTLVFFDSKGKEVFRHLGVLDKEKIVAKLKEIGMES
jgi:thioredoxin 1